MINPTLHVNKVFREQVEKCLRATFNENAMKNIKRYYEKEGYMCYWNNNVLCEQINPPQ